MKILGFGKMVTYFLGKIESYFKLNDTTISISINHRNPGVLQ